MENVNLAKALVNAQSQMKAVAMNATNPFYKSKYADLGSVIETAKPVLKANGLAVSQLVVGGSGQVGITTMLIHESGESISSTVTIPIEGNNIAQEAGKAITYLRRYALASILGMYADEDTDAHKPHVENKEPSVKDEAVKLGAVEGMTVEMAKTAISSEGVPYGELTREELVRRFNSKVDKRKKKPDEFSEIDKFKMDAAKVLIANWGK